MKLFSNIILAAAVISLAACTDSSKTETEAKGIGKTPVNFSTPGAQPTATTAGQNPAHGQPGHRCDIPVGAALSTPVQSATTAPAGIAPTPLPTPTTTTPVAPGTNPPHGQPGHDCSIAVGAPLNK